MIGTPLEQFLIVEYIPLRIGLLDLSITNAAVFMMLTSGVIVALMKMTMHKGGRMVPLAWQSIIEMLFEASRGLVKDQIGERGKEFFPLVLTLFMWLLVANVIGMIPYSYTVTSHIVVTFSISLALFIGITVIGFREHKLHFFSFFLPPGAPMGLAPFLVVLEIISYFIRAISLGVRLFANMMAGHTLVKVLAGFCWTMLGVGGWLAIASSIPFVIVFALTFLEMGIAMLQAYVFSLLVCLYLNDSVHLH